MGLCCMRNIGLQEVGLEMAGYDKQCMYDENEMG